MIVRTFDQYVQSLFSLDQPWTMFQRKELVLAVLSCVIWIPYFRFSKRVQGTFVQGTLSLFPAHPDREHPEESVARRIAPTRVKIWLVACLGILVGIGPLVYSYVSLYSSTLQWKRAVAEGRKAYGEGRYQEAAKFYEDGIQNAGSQSARNERYVVTLEALARTYLRLGDYAKAESQYQEALSLVEMGRGRLHTDITLVLDGLADLYYLRGNYNKVEPLVRRSLAIQEKERKPDDPSLAGSLGSLGQLYQRQDKFVEAEQLFR